MEEPVTFKNRKGHKLFGILHRPGDNGGPVRDAGVICLNTGMQYRVIWHRLNVKMARRFSELGYHVLRFDTHGIGDSEGELEIRSQNIEDYHDRIQTGLFVEDTLDAIDFFTEQVPMSKLFLVGPCGGALTSIHTAARDKRVSGLVYMSGPVTITSSELTLEMHPRDAQRVVKGYLPKLFNPRSWFRFISGKSEYDRIFPALKIKLKGLRGKEHLMVAEDEAAEKSGMRFNRMFFESFKKFVGPDRNILFLMPQHDRSSWGFKEMFENRFLTPGNPYESMIELHYVENANHVFALEESQQFVMDKVGEWLAARTRIRET